MQARMRFIVLAVVILCVCSTAMAQYRGGDSSGISGASAAAPSLKHRVDINHASLEELLRVSGMTRSWAVRIVRYRPYYSKRALVEKGIVTSQVYDRIKNYVIAHRDKHRSTRHRSTKAALR